MPKRKLPTARTKAGPQKLLRQTGCFLRAGEARAFALQRLSNLVQDQAQRVQSSLRRAAMLDTLAATLGAARKRIIATAARETALTLAELAPEFDRMTGTLRMFAELVREGSWVRASIDTAPQTAFARKACIGPPHDVRRMLVPLGFSAGVFGASNFPLAYGVCGGDTASALAAGLCVVVKEHPAHPQTGRLLAKLAHRAGAPLTYVYHADARNLAVSADVVNAVDAVGFTGSVEGGMAIAKLAQQDATADKPAFCEMGSVNVIHISGSLLAHPDMAEKIAFELAMSITSRVGQQCTRPGCLEMSHCSIEQRASFLKLLAAKLDAVASRRMLSEHITQRYKLRCEQLLSEGFTLLTSRRSPLVQAGGHFHAVPMLFQQAPIGGQASSRFGASRQQRSTHTQEVFGPAAIVLANDAHLGTSGALTHTFLVPENEAAICRFSGKPFQGRTVLTGVPTGVRVCHSMVHGGPYPASNAPQTTAVGSLAIERWCRPVCWQNSPQSALPWELRDRNPRKLMRMINGTWTRANV